jgi:hypothetical protein
VDLPAPSFYTDFLDTVSGPINVPSSASNSAENETLRRIPKKMLFQSVGLLFRCAGALKRNGTQSGLNGRRNG